MTTSLRGYTAAFLACLGFALPAAATTYSPDYTDIWYTQAEPGWGINIVQQRETIFASMYVYGADNTPRWYYASGLTGSQTSFSGTLYRTMGTYFAAPWNPAQLQGAIAVGSMTINFSSPTAATLSYSIDGVAVNKSIVRNTFRENNLAGNYIGGFIGNGTGCSLAGGMFIVNELTIEHSTSSPRFTVVFSSNNQSTTCTFSGQYVTHGKIGSIPNGTFGCAGGATNSGTFSMTEIYANQNGISAKYTARDNICSNYTGFFGGVRDTQ
ncbi:MAG TPA: hypothetical protein VM122_04925 [Usitatibacter sp.]|nr:hypothetical protein [Usitatibacter sp.]